MLDVSHKVKVKGVDGTERPEALMAMGEKIVAAGKGGPPAEEADLLAAASLWISHYSQQEERHAVGASPPRKSKERSLHDMAEDAPGGCIDCHHDLHLAFLYRRRGNLSARLDFICGRDEEAIKSQGGNC